MPLQVQRGWSREGRKIGGGDAAAQEEKGKKVVSFTYPQGGGGKKRLFYFRSTGVEVGGGRGKKKKRLYSLFYYLPEPGGERGRILISERSPTMNEREKRGKKERGKSQEARGRGFFQYVLWRSIKHHQKGGEKKKKKKE